MNCVMDGMVLLDNTFVGTCQGKLRLPGDQSNEVEQHRGSDEVKISETIFLNWMPHQFSALVCGENRGQCIVYALPPVEGSRALQKRRGRHGWTLSCGLVNSRGVEAVL